MSRNNPNYLWGVPGKEKLIPFPSVSSVLGIVDKSEFLTPWAANQVVEFIKNNALQQGEDYEKEWIIADAVLDQAKSSYSSVAQRAADIGSRAHELAENFGESSINWNNEPVEVYNAYTAFQGFIEKFDPIFIEREKPVVHWKALEFLLNNPFSENIPKNKYRPYTYSGTYDAIVEINGRYYLIDYKTSKGIYPTHLLQLAAYFFARLSLNGKKLRLFTDFDGPVELIIDYPEIHLDGVIAVHLDKSTGKFTDKDYVMKEIDFVKDRFDAFKTLTKFWWQFKSRDIDNAVA